MKTTTAIAVLVLLTTSFVGIADEQFVNPVYQRAKLASVMVSTESGYGSGVAFKNRTTSFIWTDAHVVKSAQAVKSVIDPKTGLSKVQVRYADVFVSQEEYQAGRKVGEFRYLAKIIRFSEREDIALLRLYKSDWPAASVSFVLAKDIPAVGQKIFHIGSMHGGPGINSFSEGTFSTAGRLRVDFSSNDTEGIIYDQISITALPGSSGCGVYDLNGNCLGLVTEFIGRNGFGAVMITPARRIREFAKSNSCEWAIDSSIAVPAKDDRIPTIDYLPAPKTVIVEPASVFTIPFFRLR